MIHGNARGADTLAGNWAKKNKIEKITAVPADWNTHGKRAGYLRNIAMADLGPECCIAFPGGRGTMMMIGICLQRNIEVIRDHDII